MMHVSCFSELNMDAGFWTQGPVESPSADSVFSYMATGKVGDLNTIPATSRNLGRKHSHKRLALIYVFKYGCKGTAVNSTHKPNLF